MLTILVAQLGNNNKLNLIGLSREELEKEMISIGEKKFRTKQLWHWLYFRGKINFSEMTTLSKELRNKLDENYTIKRPTVVKDLKSSDKTRKWLLRFEDGNEIETVYIPEEDRGAVCISAQIGCAVGCKFCNTGTQALVRNLTAGEIVSQFMAAKDACNEWPTESEKGSSSASMSPRLLSNIVLMGMGEPLHNYDNVIKAMKILMDPEGVAMSKRRITLSTSGVVPKIKNLATDLGTKLAISLHAPNDEIRSRIMPINKKYPIKKLMQACKDYQEASGNRQYITFEYLMLKGINDQDEHARELVKLVKNMEVKFNLIPFNPWEGCEYECSSNNRIRRFTKILEDAYIAAPIRQARGQDILAACGQLKSTSKKEKKCKCD
ncbi:MAG: 23S rRNA (adenine(2503)-C(2))-methyltransferase RlmN [Alphaproteobacteria bacterium]|nr:23S rRNA (adenine(2503)-C(2))-methyltransferase RlmN [Alphaproteobacteria bacterium]